MTGIADTPAANPRQRGNPTVEVDVWLKTAPWGAQPGRRAHHRRDEAVEKRDNEPDAIRQGVRDARRRQRRIANALMAWTPKTSAASQRMIESTALQQARSRQRHSRVSLAVARPPPSARPPLFRYIGGVQARVLPTPMMNIVNGGPMPTSIDIRNS